MKKAVARIVMAVVVLKPLAPSPVSPPPHIQTLAFPIASMPEPHLSPSQGPMESEVTFGAAFLMCMQETRGMRW